MAARAAGSRTEGSPWDLLGRGYRRLLERPATRGRGLKTAPAPALSKWDAAWEFTTTSSIGALQSPAGSTTSLASGIYHGDVDVGAALLEDPESDTSSASGRSWSIPTLSVPSSREASPAVFQGAPTNCDATGVLPGNYRNTTYASGMHMAQFRKESSRLSWTRFIERLKEALPEKPVLQNDLYHLVDYGSSGSVYAAVFKAFGYYDTVAVKILRSKDAGIALKPPREFQIMRGLEHNHVVAFVGSFSKNGQFGVLMYPMAICNLAEFLKYVSEGRCSDEEQRLRQSEILATALACLSSAVMYLHAHQNIKHKDIKPENILVDRYGSVFLADFGISKQYEGATVTEGTTPFTDKYAPPEVVSQDKRGLSSDIFSLGCVFLEMTTIILGLTLEELNREVFETSERRYRDNIVEVRSWIDRLQETARLRFSPPSRAHFGNCSLDRRPMLKVLHLETIFRMMSRSATERPSIDVVYECFKGFGKLCSECHSKNLPSQRMNILEMVQVVPASRVEANAGFGRTLTMLQQSRTLHRDWSSAKLGMGTSERTSPGAQGDDLTSMDIEIAEDDDLSDAESICTETDVTDGPESESDLKSQRRINCLESMIDRLLRPYLDTHRDSVLSCLGIIGGSPTGIRSCPAGDSTGGHRQGRSADEPPRKRRSHPSRRDSHTRKGDDGGSDSEEDSEEQRQNSQEQVDRLPARSSRPFACPYYQRNRSRCKNRACQFPGWAQFHRLKEHLERVHRLYSCPRCQESFLKEELLRRHQRRATACPVRDREHGDGYDWDKGFDDAQRNALRSRLRGVTGEEKWRKCYEILFPYDDKSRMPSPYYSGESAEALSDFTERLHQSVSPSIVAQIPGNLDPSEVQTAFCAFVVNYIRSHTDISDRHTQPRAALPEQAQPMQLPTPQPTRMMLDPSQIPELGSVGFQAEWNRDFYQLPPGAPPFSPNSYQNVTPASTYFQMNAAFTTDSALGMNNYTDDCIDPLPADTSADPGDIWPPNQDDLGSYPYNSEGGM